MKMRWMGLAAALLVAPMMLPAQAAGTGAAQNSKQSAERPELTGLAHVVLRVSDVDKEINFFGKMGFEEAFANAQDGRTLEAYVKVNDQQFIEVEPSSGGNGTARALGMANAAYESADLNALNARYAAAKLKPTPVHKDGAGNPIFMVTDPDGRDAVFTQYVAGSRQMIDKGQHLGERRVSDVLMGFEMPVKDMKTAQKWYEALGFDAVSEGANVRLSLPANPDLRIELHPVRTNDQVQILFPVDDAKRAADELHSAGLKVQRDKKLVFLRDPDGNAIVLMEAGEHSPRHLVPWKH